MTEALSALASNGVAVWLDDPSRERLDSGNLQELIDTRNVSGVTTNPTIFEGAITKGKQYDEQLRRLAIRGVGVDEAVRVLTAYDVRWACDILRQVYDRTNRWDGRVSIEVDPRLARNTEATVAEALALWWMVDRPNLFVKIPATREGIPAITEVIGSGISVNVTLIFSLQRYADVIDAYMTGLELARERGHDLALVESVASFFVSRVDTEIDKRLDQIGTPEAAALRGKAAIANARLAYQLFEQKFHGSRWATLEDIHRAVQQRPLWASTGVKDPTYDNTRYVVELVAPRIVNTMPESTLQAIHDSGVIRGDTITGTYDEAHAVFDGLAAVGIDYEEVVVQLENEGVEKFADSWGSLLNSVRESLARV